MKSKSRTFLFGAPWWQSDRRAFEDAITQRFITSPEAAFCYLTDVINRQITKACGLLAYNALIFGGLQLANNNSLTVKIAALLALGSSTLLLGLLYVRWGAAEEYRKVESDLASSLRVAFNRGLLITYSLLASFVATFGTAVVVILRDA